MVFVLVPCAYIEILCAFFQAAFENSDGLFGFVNDIAILKTGIAPTPVQFLEGEVEGVSVGINTEGFSGIVAFTTSSKGGSTCDLQVIQWIGDET